MNANTGSIGRIRRRAVGYAAPIGGHSPNLQVVFKKCWTFPTRAGMHDASSFTERHFLDFSVRLLSGGSACDAAFPGRPLVWLCRLLLCRGSTPTCSVFSSCGASAFFSPCPLALAGVAVHDITAQVARGRGVFGRRGFALESAAARVCAAKQEHKSPGSLRSLLKAFQLSTGPSWRSTPLWSHPSVLMASSTDDVLTWTGPSVAT